MAQNLISATLSTEDAAAVQQSLNDAKAKLNFFSALSISDIIVLFKCGSNAKGASFEIYSGGN